MCPCGGKRGRNCRLLHQRPPARARYIVTIDVLENFRRGPRGFSAAPRKWNEGLAINGVREVGLETATDNESAIAFWNKHGYRTRGVRRDITPGGRDAFVDGQDTSSAAVTSKESRVKNASCGKPSFWQCLGA